MFSDSYDRHVCIADAKFKQKDRVQAIIVMLLPNLMKLGSLVLVVSKLTDARSNAAS
jgi:hypothetical protein